MIHASKLFPLALKEAFEEGERARIAREKREKRKAADRGTICVKRKRARVNLTERKKVQLTFNL